MELAEKYFVKTSKKENAPGTWNSLICEVFQKNEDGTETKIGEYLRNYSSFYDTFFPFKHKGKEYALYSKSYTTTSVMSLLDFNHITEDDKKVFCPTGFFVPDFDEYGEDLSWYEQRREEDREKNDERGVKYWQNVIDETLKNKTIAERYALVSGCVWGDDSGGWKVSLLDLSEIEEGKLTIDFETLGYFELPHFVKLKDCVNWEDPDRFNISIGADFQFDIDNPKNSGFTGYSFASMKMFTGSDWSNFEIVKSKKNEVTRLEVVDENGRSYTNNECKIELSYQDDDRTLKIFVK